MDINIQRLKQAGLKVTEPRLTILALMYEHRKNKLQHFTAEDIYKLLIDQEQEIGLATIYRVLNQFDDANILVRHNFEGNKSFFELSPNTHHDHIICIDCGKVVEFNDEIIEKRQAEICKTMGYELQDHSLYLYAKCNKGDQCEELKQKKDKF